MKPNSEYIDQIIAAFAVMQTKEDLVKTLNLAKRSLYGARANDFALKNITYYADQRIASSRYTIFQIPKKRGGSRVIHAPVPGLKAILQTLNYVLLCVYGEGYENCAMGFVPGKSIKDNAKRHTGKQYVYNIDLKDFFPSVELHRVKAVLKQPPFNLSAEREPLAFIIANLCCEVMEVERINETGEPIKKRLAVLPQGAPTSPSITNFIARKMDRRLTGAAKRFGATYTRYADDITFSSNHNLYGNGSELFQEVRKIIAEQGFVINESKVRLQKPWFRQEVTGLIVNRHPNVQRKYVKELRQWIYLWETYGYEKATLLFRRDYAGSAPKASAVIPPLERVLEGKLMYMKMVVGEEHSTWRKLYDRFSVLSSSRMISQLAPQDLDAELEKLLHFFENNLEKPELTILDTL